MRIRGLGRLIRRLEQSAKSPAKVKETVKKHGVELERLTKRNATFTKGYQTGETKRSVSLNLTKAGFMAEVQPGTEWSYWLEKGTRFMSAQPFVGPSLKEQEPKLIKDVEKASKGE